MPFQFPSVLYVVALGSLRSPKINFWGGGVECIAFSFLHAESPKFAIKIREEVCSNSHLKLLLLIAFMSSAIIVF